MEGRDHTATTNGDSGTVPPPESPPETPKPPPENPHTYIVQIPRDQIYRVPPPENSKIAENYKTPKRPKKQNCGCGRIFCAFVVTLIVFIIGGGVMFGILHALYKPKAPIYNVTGFNAKNSSYEILLKIENPNERMGVSYEDEGRTSISYEGKKIGEGKYNAASQGAKESKNVRLNLAGLKRGIASEVEKSMKEKGAKGHVSLSLAIIVPMKLEGWKSLRRNLKVKCEITVNNSATGAKISSQDCNSEFRLNHGRGKK